MRNMIAILGVALSIVPAGVLAQELPLSSCLKCSISQAAAVVPSVSPWRKEPSREATTGVRAATTILQRQQSQQRRSVGRMVVIGTLIGAGGGAAVMLASPDCTQEGGYCGPYMGMGAGLGAGIGALVGLIVGVARR